MRNQQTDFTQKEKEFIWSCKDGLMLEITRLANEGTISISAKIEGLCSAIEKKMDDKIIDYLISYIGVENIDTFDIHGRTPLEVAISELSVSAVKKLLAKGANPNGIPKSPPPLIMLTRFYGGYYDSDDNKFDDHRLQKNKSSRIKIARALIGTDADPYLVCYDNEQKRKVCTPFFEMCRLKDYDMVEFLLDLKGTKAQINETDDYGRSALAMIVSHGNIELTKRLIALGANVNQISEFKNIDKISYPKKTPLDLAIDLKNEDLIQLLKDNHAVTALEAEEIDIRTKQNNLRLPDSFNSRDRLKDLSLKQREDIFRILETPNSESSSFLDELKNFLISDIVINPSLDSQLSQSLSFLASAINNADQSLSPKQDLHYQAALFNCELHDKMETTHRSDSQETFNTKNFLQKVIPIFTYDLLETINQKLVDDFNDESTKSDTSDLASDLERFSEIIKLQKKFSEAVKSVTGKDLKDLPIKEGPVLPPNSVIRRGKAVVIPSQEHKQVKTR